MLPTAQTDLTPWMQLGAMGLLGALLLVVGPKLLDRMFLAHRKALEDVMTANRAANLEVVSELKCISGELRNVWERLNTNNNAVTRIAVALVSRHPELAREIQKALDPQDQKSEVIKP
jgi:hypothetical protein